MSILDKLQSKHKSQQDVEMTLQEYLDLCKTDKKAYASPAERMLDAIGEPELIHTHTDPELSRIFSNRILKQYKPFKEFYGIEDSIERIVSYFKHAAQGLEESKQILYLLGPVGGSKSTLATKLIELMESQPFYAIKGSPLNDSPLALFNVTDDGDELESEYGIPKSRLSFIPSPWLTKRLKESNGDLSWITVVKRFPSRHEQIASSRTEPGDENNQDVSCLVGKTDIRKLDRFAQNDPDSYSYSGGLCLSNRGILEFVEMFKAPIKVLHPLLTATQDRMFTGTESIAAMPFEGIVLAHSNLTEWETFKNDRKNEAFIDRVYIVKVPWTVRINSEVAIYKKLLRNSTLANAPCAPMTLDLLATFNVISRLVHKRNQDVLLKARAYNGEDVKGQDNNGKTVAAYKDDAGVIEGMVDGLSTRFAFKVLSKTFNYDDVEVAANPVHMFDVLRSAIEHEQFPAEKRQMLLGILAEQIKNIYDEHLFNEIQTAYVDAYDEYGQNIFDKYILNAEYWIDDKPYRDPATGQLFDRDELDEMLKQIEFPAGIVNPSEFRHEVVTFCARASSKTGKNPKWTEYEKLKSVIEKKLFVNTEQILPIISFDAKKSNEDSKKHKNFVDRMVAAGYTRRQVEIVVQYYIKHKNTVR